MLKQVLHKVTTRLRRAKQADAPTRSRYVVRFLVNITKYSNPKHMERIKTLEKRNKISPLHRKKTLNKFKKTPPSNCALKVVRVKVKLSRYRPGEDLGVPGG
jgi:hypothetical protein